MENKQLTRNLCNMRKNLVADRVKEKEDIAYVEKGRALLSFRKRNDLVIMSGEHCNLSL